MKVSPFEIQRFLNGDNEPRRPAMTRRQSSRGFPRTAWLKSLLGGIVALALVVFGLNLIESSRIPSDGVMGHGETKECRDGSTECHDAAAPTNTANGDPQVVTRPFQQPQPQQSTGTQTLISTPAQTPVSIPSTAPTPMLRPGNVEVPDRVAVQPGDSSGTDPTTTGEMPVSPSQTMTNNQNVVYNFTYPEISAPIMNNASEIFVNKWCDLEGTEWYPKGDSAWKKRAPAFLIPGAKYSGIFAITKLLDEHPQIRPPSKGPETKFFFEPVFLKYVKQDQKTTVMQARERLLAVNYPGLNFRREPGTISYDASSGYLFRSSVLPRRLLCVLPWVKIVAVIRDPIERLYDHYLSMKFDHSLPHQLEDWIEYDKILMRKANLIPNATSTKVPSMTDEAWYDYQHNAVEGPVGRSLYYMQLRQWFQALRTIGRNPKDSVLIVRTEELVENPKREFDRILKFLGLADFTPSSFDIVSTIRGHRADEMSQETRKDLEKFFKPYQRRLEDLLKSSKVKFGSGSAKKEVSNQQ